MAQLARFSALQIPFRTVPSPGRLRAASRQA